MLAPAPATGTLEFRDVVAERAPVDGQLERTLKRGERVHKDSPLFELVESSAELSHAQATLDDLNAKHADDPEYADFIDAAKQALTAAQAKALHIVRSTESGRVVLAPFQAGDFVHRGDEILRLAETLVIHVDLAAIEGSATDCALELLERPEIGILKTSRVGSPTDGDERELRLLGDLPPELEAGPLGKIRVRCP